jgi:CO/xanthine dehydrogenase FAD-binding subunit
VKVIQPDNLAEALGLLAGADGAPTPIAGGTDLCVRWPATDKDGLSLLDLSRIRDLPRMKLMAESLELGAVTTYWDVIQAADVAAAFPLLVQVARLVGAIQIQTRGTWAGNIANGSPAADGVLAMLVYDATVVLQSAGATREVPLDAYFTGYKQSVRRPDELITCIRMPQRRYEFEWLAKVGSRLIQAISKVGVAMARCEEGWRVAANSVAPYVCRCRALENALNAGRSFESPAEIEEVFAADVAPVTDLRSTAEYRSRVLSRLIYYRLAESGPCTGGGAS